MPVAALYTAMRRAFVSTTTKLWQLTSANVDASRPKSGTSLLLCGSKMSCNQT